MKGFAVFETSSVITVHGRPTAQRCSTSIPSRTHSSHAQRNRSRADCSSRCSTISASPSGVGSIAWIATIRAFLPRASAIAQRSAWTEGREKSVGTMNVRTLELPSGEGISYDEDFCCCMLNSLRKRAVGCCPLFFKTEYDSFGTATSRAIQETTLDRDCDRGSIPADHWRLSARTVSCPSVVRSVRRPRTRK